MSDRPEVKSYRFEFSSGSSTQVDDASNAISLDEGLVILRNVDGEIIFVAPTNTIVYMKAFQSPVRGSLPVAPTAQVVTPTAAKSGEEIRHALRRERGMLGHE